MDCNQNRSGLQSTAIGDHILDQRAHMNRYVLQRISVHMRSSGICGVYGQDAQELGLDHGVGHPSFLRVRPKNRSPRGTRRSRIATSCSVPQSGRRGDRSQKASRQNDGTPVWALYEPGLAEMRLAQNGQALAYTINIQDDDEGSRKKGRHGSAFSTMRPLLHVGVALPLLLSRGADQPLWNLFGSP